MIFQGTLVLLCAVACMGQDLKSSPDMTVQNAYYSSSVDLASDVHHNEVTARSEDSLGSNFLWNLLFLAGLKLGLEAPTSIHSYIPYFQSEESASAREEGVLITNNQDTVFAVSFLTDHCSYFNNTKCQCLMLATCMNPERGQHIIALARIYEFLVETFGLAGERYAGMLNDMQEAVYQSHAGGAEKCETLYPCSHIQHLVKKMEHSSPLTYNSV